jgi:hypothetical protein
MSMGVKVFNADGSVALDVSRVTIRVIDQFDVAAGGSGSITYSGDTYSNLMAVAVPTGVSIDGLARSQPVRVSVSGLTVTWSQPVSGWGGTSLASRVIVFAYG